ncbi:MAG: type II secretion system F family protein [Rubripirellula sp.]
MPTYNYQATNVDGESVSDQFQAETVAAALQFLESQGLEVQSISQLNVDPTSQNLSVASPNLSYDQPGLESHFESALQRRDVLIPALTALADDMPVGRPRTEMRNVVTALQEAKSTNELRRSDVVMQWLPLLSSGFSSETTTQQLGDLIAHASRESENRRQRRRLLAYPIAVALVAFVVVALISAMVVPVFSGMFREFGLRLPATTRIVVFVGEQLRDHPFKFFGSIALVTIAVYGLVRWWLRLALTTRIFGMFTSGNSSNVSAMSSLTGRLAELLSIGISIPDALWIAGQGCRHHHFQLVAQQLARDAHVGRVSDSPVAHNLPANVLAAIQGTDGTPNVPLLRELATMYGERVTERVDWSTSVVAQFAIIAIGISVGFVVIALFAPLVSLVSGLS